MRPYLLDVNVLLALHWPGHDSHRGAMEWFEQEGEKSFALCPMTEAGFVRILTNAAFTGKKVEMLDASIKLWLALTEPDTFSRYQQQFLCIFR